MAEIVPLISIHAPRTGSDPLARACAGLVTISIHAPRTGSDTRQRVTPPNAKGISIHAPRTGSDANRRKSSLSVCVFQPTLPARGATYCKRAVPCQHGSISTHAPRTGSDFLPLPALARATHFNPRSPHGERRPRDTDATGCPPISTHAPRTGSDVR